MAKSAQIKKVNWWHEAIFEWMIANPEKKLRDCAVEMGVTQAWLSTIINSDVFRDKLAERRETHFANVSQDVASKIGSLADLSLDVLTERIEAEREKIGLGIVKDSAEMALKAAGYIGPRPNNDRSPHVNVFLPGSIDKETLEESRALMHQRELPLIEVKEEGENA